MKFLWCYLGFLVLLLIVSHFVASSCPPCRENIVLEDGPVESLSAFAFLAAALLALWMVRRRREQRQYLSLIFVLGLLGFLDEISWGERIFGFSMPYVHGIKIDSAHDLVGLAHRVMLAHMGLTYVVLAAGTLIMLVLIVIFWSDVVTAAEAIVREPSYTLLTIFIIAGGIAILVDIYEFPKLLVLEEVLELAMSIALVLLALNPPPRTVPVATGAERAIANRG